MPDIIVTDFNIEPFASLRTTSWEPSFDWINRPAWASPIYEVSRQINSFHENGNDHILPTCDAIMDLETVGEWTGLAITESIIKHTHAEIFPGEWWTGKWRTGRVKVGPHSPPHPDAVSYHMGKLVKVFGDISEYKEGYQGEDGRLEALLKWYYAFETIHPFQDGNGRVGGAIVAAYSHLIEPDKGWLAVNQ